MRNLSSVLFGLVVLGGSLEAAEPRVVFEDRFEGKVGDGWSWLREDAKTWRIKDGALEIRVEPQVDARTGRPPEGRRPGAAEVRVGPPVVLTVKNALLRKAPDRRKGKFAFETTVTFTANPTKQYEQAGITWYRDGEPVFKLVHELIAGKTYIIPGKIPAPERTVQLRLVVTADHFVAQFRPDGKGEFRTAAEGPLPAGPNEQVSIQCYNGPPDAEHWIRFDDFRILELAD
jgi:hypothetical protein